MTDCTAPLADIRFLLNEVAGLAEIARLPGCEEAGKFASGVPAPLDSSGGDGDSD